MLEDGDVVTLQEDVVINFLGSSLRMSASHWEIKSLCRFLWAPADHQ